VQLKPKKLLVGLSRRTINREQGEIVPKMLDFEHLQMQTGRGKETPASNFEKVAMKVGVCGCPS
jgi:hypothetical protein